MRLFKDGAYLYTLGTELSEQDFIKKAGGLEKLGPYKKYPFVSLVLDKENEGLLVGHINFRAISLAMSSHILWQTMEWR